MLTPRVKKILMLLVVVFIVYAVINSPNQSAGVVHTAFTKLGDGLQSIGQFFNALMK